MNKKGLVGGPVGANNSGIVAEALSKTNDSGGVEGALGARMVEVAVVDETLVEVKDLSSVKNEGKDLKLNVSESKNEEAMHLEGSKKKASEVDTDEDSTSSEDQAKELESEILPLGEFVNDRNGDLKLKVTESKKVEKKHVEYLKNKDGKVHTDEDSTTSEDDSLTLENEYEALRNSILASAEYVIVTDFVRPISVLIGSVAFGYATYQSPVNVANGVDFCLRQVSTLTFKGLDSLARGNGMEIAASVAGLLGGGTSGLVVPAIFYAVLKLVNTVIYSFIKVPVFLVKTLYSVLKKAVECFVALVQTLLSYRRTVALLLLVGSCSAVYFNSNANAMASPYYAKLSNFIANVAVKLGIVVPNGADIGAAFDSVISMISNGFGSFGPWVNTRWENLFVYLSMLNNYLKGLVA